MTTGRNSRRRKADEPAAVAGHPPDAHLRPVEGEALHFLEGEAEQAGGHIEGGGDDVVELEIGLELCLVEIELGLAPALGIVAPVPRRQSEIAALRRDHRLQRLLFPRDAAERRSHTAASSAATASGVFAIVSASL